MSRKPSGQDASGQRPPGVGSGGVSKRKAVPPGFLHDLLLARQHLKSVGLGAGDRGLSVGRAPSAAPAPVALASATTHHYVAATTLPLLFAQRKRYLQKHKDALPKRAPWRVGEPAGLLSLPEDVLLRVVCHLKHDEIPPLFQVCKPLRTTLRAAVSFHFNFSTPFRPTGDDDPPPCQVRHDKKRAVTNLQDVMSRLNRPQSGAAVQTAAPRALAFADSRPGTPGEVPG